MSQETQKAVVKATALIILAQQFEVFDEVLAVFGENFSEKVSQAAFEIGANIPAENQRQHFAETLIEALRESLDQIEG